MGLTEALKFSSGTTGVYQGISKALVPPNLSPWADLLETRNAGSLRAHWSSYALSTIFGLSGPT